MFLKFNFSPECQWFSCPWWIWWILMPLQPLTSCSKTRLCKGQNSIQISIVYSVTGCSLLHSICYDLQAVFSSSSHVILGYLMSHSLDLLSICWNYWSLSSSIRSFNPQGLGTSPAFGERLLSWKQAVSPSFKVI